MFQKCPTRNEFVGEYHRGIWGIDMPKMWRTGPQMLLPRSMYQPLGQPAICNISYPTIECYSSVNGGTNNPKILLKLGFPHDSPPFAGCTPQLATVTDADQLFHGGWSWSQTSKTTTSFHHSCNGALSCLAICCPDFFNGTLWRRSLDLPRLLNPFLLCVSASW